MYKITPFNGIRESIRDSISIIKGIFRVIKSGNFILGNQLSLFEQEFSKIFNVNKYLL